jgi:hypothetical protein
MFESGLHILIIIATQLYLKRNTKTSLLAFLLSGYAIGKSSTEDLEAFATGVCKGGYFIRRYTMGSYPI